MAIDARVFREACRDGFYELSLGVMFLVVAMTPIRRAIGVPRYYIEAAFIVAAMIPFLGKRYITLPRIDALELATYGKAQTRYAAPIGVIATILVVLLVWLTATHKLPWGMSWKAAALVAAAVYTVKAEFEGLSRVDIYGALFFIGVIASQVLTGYIDMPYRHLISFGVPGIGITGFGVYLLVSFVKKYPKQGTWESDAGQ